MAVVEKIELVLMGERPLVIVLRSFGFKAHPSATKNSIVKR